MDYQKVINLLDNTSNEPSKFRAKNWVEIMRKDVEHITLIIKLNLNLQC